MNEVMNFINMLTGGEPEQIIYDVQAVIQNNMPAIIAGIVIGLIICLFGLKLIRLLAGIAGALLGASIGLAVSFAFGLDGTVTLIVIVALAVVLACLSAVLYRVGAFIWMLAMGAGAAFMTFSPNSYLTALICLGAGLVLAIIATIFLDPIIIIITSVAGGFIAGISIAEQAGFEGNLLITIVISVVLAIVGLIVQFMLKSREVGKKEKLYSKEFREKESMETEVEKARMLLDGEDGGKKTSSKGQGEEDEGYLDEGYLDDDASDEGFLDEEDASDEGFLDDDDESDEGFLDDDDDITFVE